MSLGTIILIILILFLVGALPNWPHSQNWGYGPSGGVGLLVIIVVILLLFGPPVTMLGGLLVMILGLLLGAYAVSHP